MNRPSFQILIICALTFLSYGNIFFNGFVVDDSVFIGPYHPTVVEAFSGSVPPGHEGVYRPIRGLLYTVYYNLSGTNPFFYHLHSLFVHILATILVYFIIKKLIGYWTLRIGNFINAPFVGALMFGLHPIHTESITYIAASMDTTGLLLFLFSWYLYLKKHAHWSLLIATLSFFTTEMALTLPMFLMLQEFIFIQSVTAPCARGPLAQAVSTIQSVLKKTWPYFITAGGYLTIRFFILGIGARGVYLADSFYLTMLTMTKVLVHYMGLLVWPFNLMHNHIISPGIEAFVYRGYRTTAIASQTILDPEILLSIGVIGGLGWIGWKMRKLYPVVSFGIGIFFLGLLPVMEFIPQGSMMNERSLYLSSIGFVLVLGYGISFLLQHPNTKTIGTILLVFILLTYTGKTIARNADWKNNSTLWSHDIDAAPRENAYARFALGNVYYGEKQYDKAIEQYQKSVEINPGFAVGYASLARTHKDMGHTEQSNMYYGLAEKAEPGFWTKP